MYILGSVHCTASACTMKGLLGILEGLGRFTKLPEPGTSLQATAWLQSTLYNLYTGTVYNLHQELAYTVVDLPASST